MAIASRAGEAESNEMTPQRFFTYGEPPLARTASRWR
jgi:hypothetical protein